ncbi:hypothetical protein ABPG74_018409 [Tetrahymena malaccensis]
MFYKGDFDIKETWNSEGDQGHISSKNNNANPKSSNKASVETNTPNIMPKQNYGSRPQSNYNSNNLEKKPSSILNQAAKNLVGGGGINVSTSTNNNSGSNPQLDDDLARRLIKNLQMEGPPENLFQKKLHPVFGSNAPPPSAPKKGLGQQASRGSLNSQQDSDLLSSMATRLQKAEQLVKNQREEIKEKSKEIEGLKTEVEIYKQSKDSEKSAEELRKIKQENIRLQQKVHAMEKFLADYGLKWTLDEQNGDEVLKGDFDKEKLLNDVKKPKYNYHLPSEIDFNVVMRRIEELNYIVEKEGNAQEVYKDERGFNRIRKMDPVPIGFYKDGIAIKGFKFFKYGSAESKQILADILEGYFPYQLKKAYPNGCLLKVIDKADEDYNPEKQGKKMANIHNVDEDQLKPMSKEEFLQKLPNKVIKDGQIIEIRSEVQKKLDGAQKPLELQKIKKEIKDLGLQKIEEAENKKLEETGNVQAQQIYKGNEGKKRKKIAHDVLEDGSIKVHTDEYLSVQNQTISQELKENISELKIRTTKDGQNIVIYITIDANKLIRDVYRILDDFSDYFNYTLSTNYPKKNIPRDCPETLKELDLFPNSVLNLQEVK